MQETVPHLVAVIQELCFARDLDAVTTVVRTAARKLAAADGATFVLRQGDDCYYADEDAIAPLWKGRRFPMSACVSGWVMANGKPAVIPDIYADPRVPVEAYKPTFVRSMAMVPVRAQQKSIGAIGAYWREARSPSEGDVAILQTLADAAALAMANADLYRELEAAVEKAAAIDRTKDELLMLISHELRTPLMPLLGWASILRERPTDAQAVARAAEAIGRNARVELALIDQLLDVADIIAGNLDLDRRPVAVQPIVAQAIRTVGPQAENKDLRITQPDPRDSHFVRGDARRLGQAFGHLLSNAVKFTRSGGAITVGVHKAGPAVRVAIADSGVGLPAESLNSVFDPFSRVDRSTTREHGGLGLGLAITRRIVELHGGTISATSRGRDSGATFTIELPAFDGAAAAGPLTRHAAA